MNSTTEIRIDEKGDESHESWLMVAANRVTSNPPRRLFDSEISHQHYIQVTVNRCTRKRSLHQDRLFATERLMQFDLSQAQWGAFVSSFGQMGVPATLSFLQGVGTVPDAPAESRLEQSAQEVRDAGAEALAGINDHYAKVMEAFETGGKRALREALTSMGFAIANAPANMQFAANALTEHVENVVTKAQADVEAMVMTAAENGIALNPGQTLRLTAGDDTQA